MRPITVEADKMDNFKDGVDVGAEGSKIDLKLAFTDWRNEAFKIAPINYYTYYGVKSVTIDTKEAETTIMVNMNRSLPIYRLNTMVLLQKKLPRATLVH